MLAKGKRVEGLTAVKCFLQDFALESEFGKDYFQILTDEDYFNIWIKATSFHEVASTAALRPGTSRSTPPPSFVSSPLQPEQHRGGSSEVENCQKGDKEVPSLSYEDAVGHYGKLLLQNAY